LIKYKALQGRMAGALLQIVPALWRQNSRQCVAVLFLIATCQSISATQVEAIRPWYINTTNVTCVGGLPTDPSPDVLADRVIEQYRSCATSADAAATYTRTGACYVLPNVASASTHCPATVCVAWVSGGTWCGDAQVGVSMICP
jgi:hypothetical protein